MRGFLTAPRLSTLILFLLLIAVCSYWGLQILAPRPAIAPSASVDASAASLAPAAMLFGSQRGPVANAPAPSNIQVSGVAEAGPNGVVVLSVDGKPGAAYRVADTVTEGTTVRSVAIDKVVIEQRGRLIELKTPERASIAILSSGVGRPRLESERGTISPVPARAAAPATLAPAVPPPAAPRFQAPPPPPQQQIQQQQEQIQQQQVQIQQQQQLQQQQLQQQQAQQPPDQQGQQQIQSDGQPFPQGQGEPPAGEPQAQEPQPSVDPQDPARPGQVQGKAPQDPLGGARRPT